MDAAALTPESPDATLRTAQDRFIGAWGQMGSAWGISRTMAEVHALLFITGESLCTDDVMARLQISRGNASMSLRALEDWGIVRRIHRRGDRKEYFEAEADVWTMFKTIARERKKRELDPLIHTLFEIQDLTRATDAGSAVSADAADDEEADRPLDDRLTLHNQRLGDMLRFIEQIDALGQGVLHPNGAGLRSTISTLGKLL